MITEYEDYCSYEVAKMPKEKGFDGPCNCYGAYNGVNLTYRLCVTDKYTNWNKHTDKRIISYPTHQQAKRWLLKKHNIFICVLFMEDSGGFGYTIEDIVKKKIIGSSEDSSYKEPEEADDASIKHCLENLI